MTFVNGDGVDFEFNRRFAWKNTKWRGDGIAERCISLDSKSDRVISNVDEGKRRREGMVEGNFS